MFLMLIFPKDDGARDDCVGVGAGIRGAAPPAHRHLGTVRVRAPDLLMHTRHSCTFWKHRTNVGFPPHVFGNFANECRG